MLTISDVFQVVSELHEWTPALEEAYAKYLRGTAGLGRPSMEITAPAPAPGRRSARVLFALRYVLAHPRCGARSICVAVNGEFPQMPDFSHNSIHGMAKRGLIRSEGAHRNARYSITNEGRAAIGEPQIVPPKFTPPPPPPMAPATILALRYVADHPRATTREIMDGAIGPDGVTAEMIKRAVMRDRVAPFFDRHPDGRIMRWTITDAGREALAEAAQ